MPTPARWFRAICPAVACFVLLFVAAAAAPAAENTDPQVPFKKYTMPNGLEVILHQDRTVPLVHVNLWYHVGSGDETPGKSGFAHLFEHMMFQGTKNTGEDRHFQVLQEIGGQEENGSTNPNRTNYYETVPANQLETALWLESERMGYLLDAVNETSLANQREVVRNERRQSYDNRPYGKELFAISAALYPEGHPYRYLTIGRHEDLEAASLADVQNFFRRWYAPANATLTLSGDFDIPTAEKLVAKWFGTFPKSTKPAQAKIPAPKVAGPIRDEVADPLARLRRVHFAWHSPALFAPGDAELDVLASALGNPGTGRLYKLLVLEKQLAKSLQIYQGSLQMSSAFHIVADLNDDADLAEVERLILAELDRLKTAPVTDKELRRAVTAFETSYVWGLEPLSARAEQLQTYNHYLGDPGKLTWDLDRYRKATIAGVQAAAAQYLTAAGRVEIVTKPAPASPEAAAPATASAAPAPAAPVAPPKSAEESARGMRSGGAAAGPVETPRADTDRAEVLVFPQEDFRAKQPPASAAPAFTPPAVGKFALANGLDVYLVERHQLPTIAMELVFPGGRADDAKGKEGAAGLCLNLLDDGTEALDKIAFEERLADLGSEISASAAIDLQTVGMQTLRKNLDATLDLLADTLQRPGLRAVDHQRNIKTEIANLRQAKGTPTALAQRLFGPVFYGDANPAAKTATETSLGAVTPADCRAHLDAFLKPKGAKLFVTGDITRAELEAKLGSRLQAWQGTPRPGAAVGEPQPRAGRLFFSDIPGASQSVIYLGHPGPRRQAPDYYPTALMTSALGGSFNSRINLNLREDKGWAYGASAGIRYWPSTGSFRASSSVRADATKDAVRELAAEIRGMAEGGLKPEELQREKNGAILSLPGLFATGADTLGTIQGLVYFGLPLDEYARYIPSIQAVTQASANAAAKSHLKPAELKVLVVGDGATQLAGLRELLASGVLGPGELVLLDGDGNVIAEPAGK